MAAKSADNGAYSNCVHEYPNIDGIFTHVIKYGKLEEKKRIVLVIPGNVMKIVL